MVLEHSHCFICRKAEVSWVGFSRTLGPDPKDMQKVKCGNRPSSPRGFQKGLKEVAVI